MMQLGNAFQGNKCARCRQPIQSDPAFDDDLWYHRACLEEGKRALQRAHELAARFGLVPVDSRTSEE
jgi:recombinational DNA repair protein (RecF pathway)